MADSTATLPILSSATAALPRECTFSESDWRALAPYWYPVAFAHEVGAQPVAVRLLDERVVLYRLSDGKVFAARDICLHRGVPLSMGHVEGDEIICKYHGLRYDRSGQCVCIPAHPKGAISPRLHLTTYGAREAYGLIWVRLVDDGEDNFPDFSEWNDPEFIQVLPESVLLAASAGRQVEGFLDVAHFAFIHTSSFGEPDNAVVPDYPVEKTASGFVADYISTREQLRAWLQTPRRGGFPLAAALPGVVSLHREAHHLFPQRRPLKHPQHGVADLGAQDADVRAHLPQLRSRRPAAGDA